MDILQGIFNAINWLVPLFLFIAGPIIAVSVMYKFIGKIDGSPNYVAHCALGASVAACVGFLIMVSLDRWDTSLLILNKDHSSFSSADIRWVLNSCLASLAHFVLEDLWNLHSHIYNATLKDINSNNWNGIVAVVPLVFLFFVRYFWFFGLQVMRLLGLTAAMIAGWALSFWTYQVLATIVAIVFAIIAMIVGLAMNGRKSGRSSGSRGGGGGGGDYSGSDSS